MTDASKGNILLIDDDKFLVEMYGAKFNSAGYTTQICLTAKEALDALGGGFAPIALLFDITMPEMDGLEFMQQVVEKHLADDALKVALTNQNSDQERARATELGVGLYIVKASVIPSEVVAQVTAMLHKEH